jgi:VanZ family protein
MNSKKIRGKLLLFSLIILFLTITLLSLLPPKSALDLENKDKLSHLFAYFLLSLNAFLLWRISWTKIWIAFVLIGYGFLLEWIQGFVPGRESSVMDGIANSSGVIFGFLVAFLNYKIYEKS